MPPTEDAVVDGGVPITHEHEPDKPAEKQPEKSEFEKRLEALEADLKAKDAQIKELTQSERHWFERAHRAADPEPEDDGDPEPEPQRRRPAEKPETLLDDLSSRGIDAITDRGFVAKEDVARMIEERVESRLAEVTEGYNFDQMLAKEFPDIQDPKSELFQRAQTHFREMAKLDKRAATSRVALYSAAKLAKQEIAMEQERTKMQDRGREERRRERIEDQADRGRGRGYEDDDDRSSLTPLQRQVIANLGIKEEEFKQQREGGRRRG